MVQFIFELDSPEESESITGLDMGHMTMRSETSTISSRDYGEAQSMMLYLSIVELLDGVRSFIFSKSREYEFVGVDSSFSVCFTKIEGDEIEILYKKKIIDSVSSKELVESLRRASSVFWKSYKLSNDDSVFNDFELSLGRL
jgi:hypothetical protein